MRSTFLICALILSAGIYSISSSALDSSEDFGGPGPRGPMGPGPGGVHPGGPGPGFGGHPGGPVGPGPGFGGHPGGPVGPGPGFGGHPGGPVGPGPGFGGPGPGFGGRPGGPVGPGPGFGGPGPGFGGRPGGPYGPGYGGPVGPIGQPGWGWNPGSRWSIQPQWWAPQYQIPWQFIPGIPQGYWQCTAYNPQYQGYSAFGVDLDQAANAADGICEQQSYGEFCYIPQGYCNLYP
jgi:hypothetical protein